MVTRTTRRPSRHTKAKDTIKAFAPIKDRLRIDEAFDYEAQGLPCPAEAYLDSFESDDSRRNMGYALDIFAAFLSGGGLGRDQIPWHTLTAEHRDAVRGHLMERYEEGAATHAAIIAFPEGPHPRESGAAYAAPPSYQNSRASRPAPGSSLRFRATLADQTAS